MKIIVLGAGVVGVTSAYHLARDGHAVTVVDRQPVAGNETSWGNAGLVSPGHAYSWASPTAPKKLIQSLYKADTALRWRPNADPRLWSFSVGFLWNCTTRKARANTFIKAKFARYSQLMLDRVAGETGIAFDRTTSGLIYCYPTQGALDAAAKRMSVITEAGIRLEVVDARRAVEIEPALANSAHNFAGAIYAPTDESGDCHLFTRGLADWCAAHGVKFQYETTIERLVVAGGRVERVITDKGDLTADAYVLSLGSYSPFLSRTARINLPIFPVKGYSVTIPIEGRNGAPTIGGVDEHSLLGWSRLGDRLRVTSIAEISGYDAGHKPEDFLGMMKAVRALFPDGADWSKAIYWAGLRPMTPTSLPIIGRARHENLWLNTGHGSLGWTLSNGSGAALADLIAGRKPEHDVASFAPRN
jgi:D-amino-acid dehydrogenase